MEGTMRQLILTDKGGPWMLQEVPIPKPGPGQILVKMLSSSICNQTDLNTIKALHPSHDHQLTLMLPHHFRQWDNREDPLEKYYACQTYWREPYPTMIGHEGMGEIVEIGPKKDTEFPVLPGMGADPSFQVGDKVALLAVEGGLGEYVITTPPLCHVVPDNMTNDEACLTEPNFISWTVTKSLVKRCDTVCILGQGALGLIATQWARIYGASTIIATDPLKMKRELSKELGADYVIDPTTQNVTEEIEKITGGRGCDVILECAGVPDTISNIPYIAAWGAKIGCIGAYCNPVWLDWSYIHFKGMTVYSCQSITQRNTVEVMDRCMREMSQEKARGNFNLEKLITHHIKCTVEDVNAIFREIDEKGTVVKAVMHFD